MSNLQDELTVASITVCVSDLEKSKRFYCEGLGFTAGVARENVLPVAVGSQGWGMTSDAKLRGVFISRPDYAMRLISFDDPKPIGGSDQKPLNHIGPRAMIVLTKDPKAVAERLVELGGKIVKEPDASGRFAVAFVTDPDGFLLQLEDIAPESFRQSFKQ